MHISWTDVSGLLVSCGSLFRIMNLTDSNINRLVVIPLSFLRRLDSLKYTSFIALVSIGYLVIIVLAHFLIGDTLSDRGAIRPIAPAGPIEVLSSFPIIVFAYTCHQNVPPPHLLPY